MIVSTISKNLSIAIASVAALTLSTEKAAQAAQVGASAFGSGTIVESFEGLSSDSNIPSGLDGYLNPGVTGLYTFKSGATLTNPIPNSGRNRGVVVGDFAIGSATFNLSSNGAILSAADVPDGSAHIAIDSPASAGPVEFTFVSPIFRVGAFVTSNGAPNYPICL